MKFHLHDGVTLAHCPRPETQMNWNRCEMRRSLRKDGKTPWTLL